MRFGNKTHCWEPIRLQGFFFSFFRQESPIDWEEQILGLFMCLKKQHSHLLLTVFIVLLLIYCMFCFFFCFFAHRCQSSWFSAKHSLAWYSASFEVCNMWPLSRVWKNNTTQKKTLQYQKPHWNYSKIPKYPRSLGFVKSEYRNVKWIYLQNRITVNPFAPSF